MGFFCSGCYYSEYRSIAYPLSSFPSGGVFNKRPDYYHDYENHMRQKKRVREEQEEQERSERFKNFFEGFFGFNEDDSNKESLDRDYPYNVFGLKRSASDDDMKKAYRKAVLKAHPDKGGSNELFRKIRQAWEYFTKNI
jgi:DnaJ-domain-containing protein 1